MDKKMKIFLAIGIIVLLAIIAISIFAYRNLNYDYFNANFMNKTGYKLGFTENTAILDDGSEIYCIEGPNNGPALLLLHGQQASSFDYAKVLPELSKEFHVYALDYYGHGKSSKDPEKYNAVAIGNDIIWFIENVIQDKVYISGHSSGALLLLTFPPMRLNTLSLPSSKTGPSFPPFPGERKRQFRGWASKSCMTISIKVRSTLSWNMHWNMTTCRQSSTPKIPRPGIKL